jgi:hypothetical protein
LEIKERVLCGFCLGNLIERMPRRKKYLFWEYGKRGYWRGLWSVMMKGGKNKVNHGNYERIMEE